MMNIPPAREASRDERLWAALAHGSVILLSWGVVVPLIVWITQRHRSRFAAFHALQALTYQLLRAVVSTALMFGMPVVVLALLPLASSAAASSDTLAPVNMLAAQFAACGFIVCGLGLYASVGTLGAMLTATGREFRYPLFGRWLQRYLEVPPASESQEPK